MERFHIKLQMSEFKKILWKKIEKTSFLKETKIACKIFPGK